MTSSTARLFSFGVAIAFGLFVWNARARAEQTRSSELVRIAEIEINPVHLDAYKAALREEIATSVRTEPGVISLLAVAVKGQPNQIRLFERYSSPAAYQSHIHSPHFLKYKTETAAMVKSLRLIETDPILLGTKTQ